MSEIIITSYFAVDGIPETGLTPSIRIWEVNSTGQKLIIGSSQGSGNSGAVGGGPGGSTGTDGTMAEVYDNSNNGSIGGSRDAFYRYTFSEANGYDPSKCYTFRVDGGQSLDPSERYQVGELNITDNADAMVDLIFDESAADHVNAGSFGEVINQINATATQTFMDLGDVLALMDILRKYQTNKTKFLAATKQLVVYDDDCTTPLRVFNMYDSAGNPSLTEMCERVPTSATDGQPVC